MNLEKTLDLLLLIVCSICMLWGLYIEKTYIINICAFILIYYELRFNKNNGGKQWLMKKHSIEY